MLIKVGTTTLASNSAAVGDDYGPASDVHVVQDTTIQESKPIGSALRKLFARGNAGGTLSFTVRARYQDLDDAAHGAWDIAANRGLSGALTVKAGPETSSESQASTAESAIVRRVETRQIGVTVEARYEIEFR